MSNLDNVIKIGDKVNWQGFAGVVLETRDTHPMKGDLPKIAVLVDMPELPESKQWFHQEELNECN